MKRQTYLNRQNQQSSLNDTYTSIITILLFVGLVFQSSITIAQNKGNNTSTIAKPILIGMVTRAFGANLPQAFGLAEGLVNLGYTEHEDFVIGVRFTSGDSSQFAPVTQSLIESDVNIIVSIADSASSEVSLLNIPVPQLFTDVSDPVGLGLIDSFAKPGGNITGIASLDNKLNQQRLQIFSEMVPSMTRILYPYVSETDLNLSVVQTTAEQLGLKLLTKLFRSAAEAESFFESLNPSFFDGIFLPAGAIEKNVTGFALEAARKHNIPTFGMADEFVVVGALASYGPSYHNSGLQLARLLDKILKGEKPGDIPVEVSRKFDLTVNMNVVKELGLTLPPEILYQITRMIRE